MNKIISLAALMGVILMLTPSCSKDEIKNATISGKAQKGPYVTGTTVTINELNSKLNQTGRSFTTTIASNDGHFDLEGVDLASSYCLLTANGYYFSEIYGEQSSGMLSLQALADLNDKKTVNINVLTHLTKGRIEKLVSDGSS